MHFTSAALLLAILSPLSSATAQVIGCGQATSLVVCSDQTAMSWGFGIYGQLGNGASTTINLPGAISALTDVVGVAGGSGQGLAVKSDGTVWAFGQNGFGELGNGGGPNSNVPVQVVGLTDAVLAAGGEGFSIALKSNGTVCGWGLNLSGQLGNGTGSNSATPVLASGLTNVITVRSGRRHVIALKNDGTVWTWGSGSFGQLGHGTNSNSTVPVQVSSLSGIVAIAAGGLQSYAVKNDGTLWAWGNNANGQSGNGTNVDSNVPVQSLLTDVTMIEGGWDHAVALKNDGTLWSWGYNSFGQLGDGSLSINSTVPVEVSVPAGVTALAGGGMAHVLALLDDGTLWGWGNNGEGELGIGNYTDSNVPVQVTGLCAIATDINETPDGSSIKVFPNPSTGQFSVQGTTTGMQQVEIRDVVGQGVHRSAMTGPVTTIDLSSQPDGIYFLSIRTAVEVVTRTLIKQ